MYQYAHWSLPCLPQGPPQEHIITIERDGLRLVTIPQVGMVEAVINLTVIAVLTKLEQAGYCVTQDPDFSTRWQARSPGNALVLDVELQPQSLAN